MLPLIRHEGVVIPLDRSNVDTDAIIPKQFLKSIKKSGFGPNLFDEWRYLDQGEPGEDSTLRKINPDFVLNKPQFAKGTILLARENFGCGSSREHAPWALLDYGIRIILAPSFADIFYGNCFKNGILPIAISKELTNTFFDKSQSSQGLRLLIDLENQFIIDGSDKHDFDIDAFKKYCLLEGLDDIGLTLKHSVDIKNFENNYHSQFPWLTK
ncbi:3-isopropylmalate dehydratase small subunit [Methylophilaceae bacterium]|jgi:3-isopropylmalate/(R)-2-methylmalate dehydratase small subunit|uniref:3-isopropylmalate dehydratase small subunit n=1 Tax=Methylophilales bacterium HTCC2181 TaxID=383631 RepID=A0P6H9_9PROT|nr:isopropylmalate isomerase small subunit [Methylophilales bacterium HTCC2181]MBT3513544.1 3-isopropylmalate dehydratase small subunit [Nitrosomonadales bacterium]MCH9842417.1 3-isopropylmalate dehydratase small subunit [Betaproteobacteria bacterium]MDA9096796.1 3-isopropylmalate dehydratase small subunit [Methylophilaceae bacterium]MBT6140584.1 3-isopropylmalate dehydratase small subunit [Nitrosomonadales bacterium]|tara:strand:- start:1295 stop:1930 length:636 start_codon:yes stop_codon:yes gene_type:complete